MIMDEYRREEVQFRPKIFGMTASPMLGRKKKNKKKQEKKENKRKQTGELTMKGKCFVIATTLIFLKIFFSFLYNFSNRVL